MNMRERIASTVHAKLSRQDIMAYLDGDFDAGDIADAVLEAMMEPDSRMTSDGAFQIFRGQRITEDDTDAARRVWRAMLTAAKG